MQQPNEYLTGITAKIAAEILNWMVVGGMTVQQAYDKVMGQSAYECLAYELHEAFTGEAA